MPPALDTERGQVKERSARGKETDFLLGPPGGAQTHEADLGGPTLCLQDSKTMLFEATHLVVATTGNQHTLLVEKQWTH